MYLTVQDLSNFNIKVNSPVGAIGDSGVLKDLIAEDVASAEKKFMQTGEDYYKMKHDIKSVDFKTYRDANNKLQTQENKANHRLPHDFFGRMNDEKMDYLLKKPVTISHIQDAIEKTPDGEIVARTEMKDLAEKTLGPDFHDVIYDIGLNAGNKGMEWVHFYIGKRKKNINGGYEDGGFKYVIAPAQGIIPIYDTSRQETLVGVIRYYIVKVIEDGGKASRIHAEWWNDKNVTHFEQDRNGEYVKVTGKINLPHFSYKNKAGVNKSGSWGRPPFACLKNNSLAMSDLLRIKELIDAYNEGESIFENMVEDVSKAVVKVKGINAKPEKIREMLHKFGVITVDGEHSDIDYLSIEVPTEGRKRSSEELKRNIYSFGRGTNPDDDKFGNSLSGVALKVLFTPLELKAAAMERKYQKFLREFMWFMCRYIKMTGGKAYDPNEFKFTFNKTLIINEKEEIEKLVMSELDRQTFLEMNPVTADRVALILQRIMDERAVDPSLDDEEVEEIEEDDETTE